MRSTIGGLEVVTIQQRPGPPAGLVVLCHGFGAPGADLVGLAEALVQLEPVLAPVRFHFPAAPLTLAELGFGDARAWWMIDFETIASLRGADEATIRAFRRQEPEGMPAARRALSALVRSVLDTSGLPTSKLVLGGFSQGAMVATDVGLRLEEAPAGLAILSGTLLLEDVWEQKAKARAGLHVFQSHGREDQVLPFAASEWLAALLTGAGVVVESRPFEGGHEIPLEVMQHLARFLSTRLGLG
jgi:phospholipase/carboxylesterase